MILVNEATGYSFSVTDHLFLKAIRRFITLAYTVITSKLNWLVIQYILVLQIFFIKLYKLYLIVLII